MQMINVTVIHWFENITMINWRTYVTPGLIPNFVQENCANIPYITKSKQNRNIDIFQRKNKEKSNQR